MACFLAWKLSNHLNNKRSGMHQKFHWWGWTSFVKYWASCWTGTGGASCHAIKVSLHETSTRFLRCVPLCLCPALRDQGAFRHLQNCSLRVVQTVLSLHVRLPVLNTRIELWCTIILQCAEEKLRTVKILWVFKKSANDTDKRYRYQHHSSPFSLPVVPCGAVRLAPGVGCLDSVAHWHANLDLSGPAHCTQDIWRCPWFKPEWTWFPWFPWFPQPANQKWFQGFEIAFWWRNK